MTNIKLAIAIMTHPSRADMCGELQAQLRADGHEPTVVRDNGANSCWQTAERAWLTLLGRASMDPAITHLLVLQDDAVLCRDFPNQAARAISAVPTAPVVCLYWQPSRQRDEQLVRSEHWITMNSCPSGLALAMPVGEAREFLCWQAARFDPACDADDTRIGAWVMFTGRRCWVTMPSLVDHRGDESLLDHNFPFPRRAARFAGDDADTIIWARGVTDPPYVEPFHRALYAEYVTHG